MNLNRRAILGGALALSACAQTGARISAPVDNSPPAMPRPPSENGFAAIFNGASLDGWEGDPRYWRVEAGAIVGEVTPETLLQSNTFLVWRGGAPRDFELKLSCRMSAVGNSGINYRGVMVADEITPANQFAMCGLQFDIDARDLFTGNVYEERGRRFIAMRGQFTRVNTQPSQIISTIGDAAALRAALTGEWRTYHIIAHGPALYHIANGQLMSAAIDEAPISGGLIGMQVHQGPPMKVEFRNVRLKPL